MMTMMTVFWIGMTTANLFPILLKEIWTVGTNVYVLENIFFVCFDVSILLEESEKLW